MENRKNATLAAALLLCFALLVTMCGCYSDSEDAGYYEVMSIDSTDITADGEELAENGIEPSSVSLYLDEDRTGYLNMNGVKCNLTWSDRSMNINGTKVYYGRIADVITMNTVQGEVEFVRVGDAPTE